MKKVKGVTLDGKIIIGKNWKQVFSKAPDIIILPISKNNKCIDIENFDFNKFFKPIYQRKLNQLKESKDL